MIDIYTYFFFFFNDTATTEIYTLSLHDALPIFKSFFRFFLLPLTEFAHTSSSTHELRSEEHTSELQSQSNLVCRLLLEKKKINLTQLQTHTLNSSYYIAYEGPSLQDSATERWDT